MCFKVLDDIKQSVRTAASSLARTLISILVRNLESGDGNSQDTTKMLKVVLPFLLSTSGIESSAKEVQMISLYSLLEIIKKGRGPALRAFIPELVESLLGLLTSLEPQQINSIYMNASKYGLTEQTIDKVRETSVSSSPLMDAIERCVDTLDDDSMLQFVVKLQQAMRTAVGMPSKVRSWVFIINYRYQADAKLTITQIGCSRVLISLSTRRNFLFRPYADQFVDAIQKHISDRNEAVCSSYAMALGYVARMSSDQSILKIAAYARRLYFASEEARSRVISGEAVRAVGKHATDRFASLASAFLPLVFIARHDEDLQVRKLYQEVWDDNTGGPRAASLYLREIVMLAEENLTSKRWILKHAAALSIAEVADAVVQAQGRVGGSEGELLWPALSKALAEKSWLGKEKVLEGFAAFVKGGRDFWKTPSRLEIREAIRKVCHTPIHQLCALRDMPSPPPLSPLYPSTEIPDCQSLRMKHGHFPRQLMSQVVGLHVLYVQDLLSRRHGHAKPEVAAVDRNWRQEMGRLCIVKPRYTMHESMRPNERGKMLATLSMRHAACHT